MTKKKISRTKKGLAIVSLVLLIVSIPFLILLTVRHGETGDPKTSEAARMFLRAGPIISDLQFDSGSI